jgi:hypothetical protein
MTSGDNLRPASRRSTLLLVMSRKWPSVLMALISAALWGLSAFVTIPYGIGADPGSAYERIATLNTFAAWLYPLFWGPLDDLFKTAR